VFLPFRFQPGKLPGFFLIEFIVFNDERGFFMETYKRSEFESAGIPDFVQRNHSHSSRGTLRGLHYQRNPKAQGKLVRVIAGEIFDVAVDLRRHEPSFGAWDGFELSAESRKMIYIPPWCAHGFCVLSETADVLYETTAEYSKELEGGILWNDPDLGIDWPLTTPVLSERDQRLPCLRDADTGF
jgi:dTDP-4-dehydrorhamnose 3,5-epimerase